LVATTFGNIFPLSDESIIDISLDTVILYHMPGLVCSCSIMTSLLNW